MTERTRILKVGGVLLGLVVLGLIAGSVLVNRGGSTPPITTSPTPTTTDVKATVEQAYLHAWDVWADALLKLDTSRLSDALTSDALAKVISQVEDQRRKNQPVRISVQHDYVISLISSTAFSIDDRYINHSVRLDPKTQQPIEPDPKQPVHRSFTLRLVNEIWKIADIIEVK